MKLKILLHFLSLLCIANAQGVNRSFSVEAIEDTFDLKDYSLESKGLSPDSLSIEFAFVALSMIPSEFLDFTEGDNYDPAEISFDFEQFNDAMIWGTIASLRFLFDMAAKEMGDKGQLVSDEDYVALHFRLNGFLEAHSDSLLYAMLNKENKVPLQLNDVKEMSMDAQRLIQFIFNKGIRENLLTFASENSQYEGKKMIKKWTELALDVFQVQENSRISKEIQKMIMTHFKENI